MSIAASARPPSPSTSTAPRACSESKAAAASVPSATKSWAAVACSAKAPTQRPPTPVHRGPKTLLEAWQKTEDCRLTLLVAEVFFDEWTVILGDESTSFASSNRMRTSWAALEHKAGGPGTPLVDVVVLFVDRNAAWVEAMSRSLVNSDSPDLRALEEARSLPWAGKIGGVLRLPRPASASPPRFVARAFGVLLFDPQSQEVLLVRNQDSRPLIYTYFAFLWWAAHHRDLGPWEFTPNVAEMHDSELQAMSTVNTGDGLLEWIRGCLQFHKRHQTHVRQIVRDERDDLAAQEGFDHMARAAVQEATSRKEAGRSKTNRSWAVPKGGMKGKDKGSPAQAAIRELEEETKIRLTKENLMSQFAFDMPYHAENNTASDRWSRTVVFPAECVSSEIKSKLPESRNEMAQISFMTIEEMMAQASPAQSSAIAAFVSSRQATARDA